MLSRSLRRVDARVDRDLVTVSVEVAHHVAEVVQVAAEHVGEDKRFLRHGLRPARMASRIAPPLATPEPGAAPHNALP